MFPPAEPENIIKAAVPATVNDTFEKKNKAEIEIFREQLNALHNTHAQQ